MTGPVVNDDVVDGGNVGVNGANNDDGRAGNDG